MFRSHGINSLIASYGEIYPSLVRVFYSNMELKYVVNIISNVKGTPITLTLKSIREALRYSL